MELIISAVGRRTCFGIVSWMAQEIEDMTGSVILELTRRGSGGLMGSETEAMKGHGGMIETGGATEALEVERKQSLEAQAEQMTWSWV